MPLESADPHNFDVLWETIGFKNINSINLTFSGNKCLEQNTVPQKNKQELYFVKENYEIFSTEVSAGEKQGQNSGEPH